MRDVDCGKIFMQVIRPISVLHRGNGKYFLCVPCNILLHA